MGAPMAYPMPPPMVAEPAEVQSIKSMLHVARILAIIFGILFLLVAIGTAVVAIAVGIGILVSTVWLLIGVVVAALVYTQMRSIEAKVDAHQYEAAKSQTLIWMVLGFIFGIILGIILLLAFIKFDPLINWQRTQGAVPPPGYAPQYVAPSVAAPSSMPPPPVAASPQASPAVPFCSKCGKPTTYIAQYGRYYCYADNLYV